MSRCPSVHIVLHCACNGTFRIPLTQFCLQQSYSSYCTHNARFMRMSNMHWTAECSATTSSLPYWWPNGDEPKTTRGCNKIGPRLYLQASSTLVPSMQFGSYQIQQTTIAPPTNSNNHNCCWFTPLQTTQLLWLGDSDLMCSLTP